MDYSLPGSSVHGTSQARTLEWVVWHVVVVQSPGSSVLSQWYCSTISSSATPFSSCLQSFPASEPFPMSQLFASGGQSIGASASAPVFPINIHGLFPLGLTDLISLLSKGLARVFFSTTIRKHQCINSLVLSLLYGPTLTTVHDYWKNHSFDYTDLCWQSIVSAFKLSL